MPPQSWGGAPNDDGISALRGLISAIAGLRNAFSGLQDQAGTVGSFTMSAAASLVVPNVTIKSTSKVFLTPENAAAATLIAGADNLYCAPADHVTGVSFTVRTAAAGSAAGTEIFGYRVVNVI